MTFEQITTFFVQKYGAEESTMMGTPCLRFKGQFFSMMFLKEDSLIVKVPQERVKEIIASGKGREFNFTKKRFKEWVLIPKEFEDDYETFALEALEYVKSL